MANDYTTSTDIWAELPESGYGTSDSTGYDQAVVTWIAVASRLIDAELGVTAGAFSATDSTTYYYDGSGEDEQDIGLWVSITTVSVSENGEVVSTGYTDLASGDFITWPYNSTPIKKLIMDNLNGSGDVSTFYHFRKAVKVTGVPGYSSIPPACVAQACRIQVVRWLQRAKQMWQDQGASVEIGGLVVKGQTQLDPDVKAMLWPLKLELSA